MAEDMSCDKTFSTDYMLLAQEDASVADLFRLLIFKDIEKRKFIDAPASRVENFKYRWLIFVSILAQKTLHLISTPMTWSGSLIEGGINLVSNNRNVFVLIGNFFRGKVVKVDPNSAKFISFTGCLDKRVEMDKNIKPGDRRYNATLAMMASKASYENRAYLEEIVRDHWKMEFVDCFDFYNDYQKKATTQAFLLRDKTSDPELVVVAFRGTETFDADAWCTDFDMSWYELSAFGKVHGGFMKALGLQKSCGWAENDKKRADNEPALAYYAIRDLLRKILQENEQARFIVTGHSLGGALAILFPAVLAFHGEEWLLQKLEGIYTFGQPRVGDEKFGDYMTEKLKTYDVPYYRFVYCNDIVPRLPYDDRTLMFKHFGTCLYFNCSYKGKVVLEEPNKNYFSPLSLLPKTWIATREFIRSFTIAYSKGPEYREGFVLRIMRLIGLVIAGIPAHSPQDYVNATRLGSPDLYVRVQDSNGQENAC